MEDLDTPRVVPGCASQMLRTLENFALTWDGPVEYQSQHTDAYHEALKRLQRAGGNLRMQLHAAQSARVRAATRAPAAQDPRAPARRRPACGWTAAHSSFEDRIQGSCAYQTRRARGCDRAPPRRGHRLPARGGGGRCPAGHHRCRARRGPARQHALADRCCRGHWDCPGVRYAHLPLVTEPDGSEAGQIAPLGAAGSPPGRPAAVPGAAAAAAVPSRRA